MAKVSLWDEFLTNEKVAALNDAAFRLYVLSIVYCGKELTDGVLDKRALTTISAWSGRPTKALVARLVAARFFEPREDSTYYIHDYLLHQQSKAEILEAREKAAARQRKFRETHAAIEDSLDNDERNALHNADGDTSRNDAPSLNPAFSPESKTQSPRFSSYEGGHDFQISEIIKACCATPEDAEKVKRAARGCSEHHLVEALRACKGPGVRDRLGVALSELKKRREQVA